MRGLLRSTYCGVPRDKKKIHYKNVLFKKQKPYCFFQNFHPWSIEVEPAEREVVADRYSKGKFSFYPSTINTIKPFLHIPSAGNNGEKDLLNIIGFRLVFLNKK